MIKCPEITDISVVTDTIWISVEKLMPKVPLRYNTDNINIGNISRYFQYIDPSHLYAT